MNRSSLIIFTLVLSILYTTTVGFVITIDSAYISARISQSISQAVQFAQTKTHKTASLMRAAVPKIAGHVTSCANTCIARISQSILQAGHFVQRHKTAAYLTTAMLGVALLKYAYSHTLNRYLTNAVCLGNTRTVKNLISAGANVNAKNSANLFPLHLAITAHNPEMVNVLLNAGADSNATTSFYFGRTDSETPLYWALMHANRTTFGTTLDIVDALIAHGADVNYSKRVGGGTLLHNIIYAESTTSVPCAEVVLTAYIGRLIHAGANIQAKNAQNKTPLEYVSWLSRQQSRGHTQNTKAIQHILQQLPLNLLLARANHPRLGEHSPLALLPQTLLQDISKLVCQ